MQGINEESLPSFDFFQIKRSSISIYTDKNEENQMICLVDISQKILADNSKAEG